MHSGDNPTYYCEFCEYSSSSKDHLISHENGHTAAPKPTDDEQDITEEFICDICNKSFTRKENLTRHKKIHADIRPHSCDICDKSFRQKNELAYHKSRNVYYLYKHNLFHNPLDKMCLFECFNASVSVCFFVS